MLMAVRESVPGEKLFCDLTQSWSEVGGGVRTFLLRKRQHILETTAHGHLMIIPGRRDSIVEEGRAITVTIASPRVPGSPHYRLMLRNGAVRHALERFRPDLIECQDAYNLPWAAIRHRRSNPEVALVAAYCTDFPTVYLERPWSRIVGPAVGSALGRLGYAYCRKLYRHFDTLFAFGEAGGAAKLRALGLNAAVVPLGVELDQFSPSRRDPALRRRLGVGDHEPLIVYAGRLDGEKKPDVVVDAFRRLPASLGARLLLIGEGPLRDSIAALGDPRITLTGYVTDRAELARWLASADLYASGMADETFGISIIEAQAAGLPVAGVLAGAMIDRVSAATGRLGPVGDGAAMARNIVELWNGDRVAMSAAAVTCARQFSWDASMEMLFGHVYPAAFAAREKLALDPLRGRGETLAAA